MADHDVGRICGESELEGPHPREIRGLHVDVGCANDARLRSRFAVDSRPLLVQRFRRRVSGIEDVDLVTPSRQAEREERRRGPDTPVRWYPSSWAVTIVIRLGVIAALGAVVLRCGGRCPAVGPRAGLCASAASPAASRASDPNWSGSVRSSCSTTSRPSLGLLSSVPGSELRATSGSGIDTARAPRH